MRSPEPAAPFRTRAERVFIRPALVLIGCLVLTLLATVLAWRAVEARREAALQAAVDAEMTRLESRVAAYLAILRATRSLILAEGSTPSAEHFATFIAGLRIAEDYPGIQGIGWSPKVGPGDGDFRILFLEPLDLRNRAALGYNMHSEQSRAEAMDRARDEGRFAASSAVVLKQEIQPEKSPGFLIYAPLYKGGDVPATVEERRSLLLGFVYAPFRANDFFASVFDAEAPVQVSSIEANGSPESAELLYGHAGGGEAAVTRVYRLGGQAWTLRFKPVATHLRHPDVPTTAVVFGAGLLITVLLFNLARSQSRRRRRAEVQAAAMERQAQFAELLVGIVSHDLRNPMNVIQLNATLLQRAQLQEEFSRCVQRIESSTAMSMRLIRDLLDFTQARLGRGIPVVRTPGDLVGIVQQSLDEIRLAHPTRSITLEAEGDGAGTWDADRIRQLVDNLVSNALVYGAAESPVQVRIDARGTQVELSVHNEGEPISPELQATLFEPMQQGSSRAGAASRNIGLGLYIVREIVRAHGGSVQCESTRGTGTTFVVKLQRTGAEDARATPVAAAGGRAST